MIKARIKVGTLKFEQGEFKAGDIIEVTDERFKLFDPADVEAIEEAISKSELDLKQVTSDTITVSEVPPSGLESPKQQPKPRRTRAGE